MIWLFRLFVFVGLLVVIALFSALFAPYFVNWERFTASFEEQASRIVGQSVKVGGKSHLKLLPLPFVSFEDLQVGVNEDGQPLMTVERFSLNMELFPFLSGEARIVDMAMLRPKVNLKVAENGTIAWTSPQEVVVNPEQINIEKLSIENGSIIVDGLAGGRTLNVNNIQGELSAGSILGPWKIEADADVEGIASELKISTGIFHDNDRSLRLKVEALRRDQPYRVLLDGPVKLEEDVLNWYGKFSVSPFSEAKIAEMARPIKALPVHSEGDFLVTPKTVEIPDYRMEVGAREDPYTLTGSGRVAIQDEVFFRFNVDGRQIDLDRLNQSTASNNVPAFERRIAALRSILDRIPVPGGKGEINAILPAIVAGDTFVRDVKAIVRPADGNWDIRSFSATFPGNTAVEASGQLGLRENFGFSGKLLIASRQPSGLASWMSGDVDAQIRRLKVLGLSSDVTLSPRQAVLDNLELRLDDALLEGKLRRLASVDGRAAIVAQLSGNRVNIQDLRALYSLTRSSSENELASHDLDIQIKADLLEAKVLDLPVNAGAVDAQIRVKSGNVTVEKLNAGDFYGARVFSVGRLENLLTRPDGNFKLDIAAENARGLLNFAQGFTGQHFIMDTLLAERALTQDTGLSVELDTRSTENGTKGQLLIEGVSGGTKLDIRASFDGPVSKIHEAGLSVSAGFNNPTPSILIRQFALQTLPEDLTGSVPGPLGVSVELKSAEDDGYATNLSISAPATNVSANGRVHFISTQDADIDLDVTIGSGDLAPYLLLLGAPMPSAILDGDLPVSLNFNLNKKNPTIKFDGISGQVAGNTVSGNLGYQFAQVQRPRLSGGLEVSRFSIPVLADSVFGFSTLLGAGFIEYGLDQEFQRAGFSGFDANIKLSAGTVDTGFGAPGSEAGTTLVMLDGAIDLNDLRFKAWGGEFSGNGGLKNVEGTAVGSLQFTITDANLGELGRLADVSSHLGGRVSLNGAVETSGRSQSAMLANLAGNGIVTLSQAEITGIDLSAFSNILLETDAEGFEVTSERVIELVEETVLLSGFSVEKIETPFSVTRGRAKIRNLVHQTPQADLNNNLELDLAKASVNVSTALAFKPSRREAISGTDPAVVLSWDGPYREPVRSIDASQLEGYLTIRAFENSQRRIETLEAQVIEKQRIQREIAFNFAREQYKARKAEEARRLFEEQQQKLAEAERKRMEEAVRRLEAERNRLAEEARRREEQARIAEEARLAEEARKREELRKAEEARLAEERRKATEAARLEEERKAAARKAAEQSAARPQTQQQTGSGIISEPLPPAQPSDGESDTPSLRKSIIKNIENFLQGN